MNSIGKTGEELARTYLDQKGYVILENNFRVPFGEIDIIAEKNNCICFVEVKSRKSYKYGLPEEAITPYKKDKIIKVALLYIKKKRIENKIFRFDIISIIFDSNNKITKIKHITDAFCQ